MPVKFEDLEFVRRNEARGVQAIVSFPNGYGASVIRGPYSYGGEDGLYELAVLKNGTLCYSTPVTDDVLGFLSEDGISAALAKIEALEP